MIKYEPLWETMKEKNITKYQLIYHWGISANTIQRLSRNESVSVNTLNELCVILNCNIRDVAVFCCSDEEKLWKDQKKRETKIRFPHKRL